MIMQYKHRAQRMDIFNNLVKESSNIILKDRESADKPKKHLFKWKENSSYLWLFEIAR